MGYTHYWYREQELDKDGFAAAASDCKKIVAKAVDSKIKIGNGCGDEADPSIGADAIIFNGVGEEAHETFGIEQITCKESGGFGESTKGMVFDFCKTACKPYDVVVVACLVALKKHLGMDFIVHSDGSEDEMFSGKQLCEAACGYGNDITLLNEE